MMPQYRCVDSYPHQRNQSAFTPYQAFPTHVPMDPARSGILYEPWPNGGKYRYPMPCHSCCNQGIFPGYYGFRPYVPAPMQSPVHFCGGYPTPYAEAYPSHYASLPQPHYSMDLPSYEYDKNMPRSHCCCGCPHHFYNPKEEKSVKIEEQKPEFVERKESLFPNQMKNHPQPIIWIPQENLQDRRSFEPAVSEQEKVTPKTREPESSKSCEQEPGIWNGWFPLGMNKSLMHDGDVKKTHDQGKEQKRELSFPIIWIPSYDNKQEEIGKSDSRDRNGAKDQQTDDRRKEFPFPSIWMPPLESKQEEAGKKGNKDVRSNAKYEENPPSTFIVVTEKHPGYGNSSDKPVVDGENHVARSGVEMKKTNQKSIPVKQIDEHEVDNLEETKKRGRDVPVKKSSESNDRSSSSPPKTSKLPPVCLRVDPLPRKKNGSSRSPSPPCLKSHPQEITRDTAEASTGVNENAQQDSKSHKIASSCSEVEPNEKEKKVIEVTERKISGNSDGDRMDVSVPINLPMQPAADVSSKLVSEKTMKERTECQIKEDEIASKVSNVKSEKAEEATKATDTAKSLGEEGKLEKKTLSDAEAAIAIQSAYRGFDVRRWEPLKKLKQIAEIRQQLIDVRNQIQALESSYDILNGNKQKVVIGETIMRLLLKLDAIQGLPPSFRDIRKSLARELVNLQEKLDSLMIKNFQESEAEVSTSETVETIDEGVQNSESMRKQELQEATKHGEKESSIQDVYESSLDTTEPCAAQLPRRIDSRHGLKDEETSVSLSENSIQHAISEDDLQTPPPMSFDEIQHKDQNAEEPSLEPKDKVINGELKASPMMVPKTDKAEDAADPKQFVQVPSAIEEKTESNIQETDFEPSHLTCMQTKDLEEPPYGANDNEPVTIEFEEDKQIEMDKSQILRASEGECASQGSSPEDTDNGATAFGEDADMSIEQVQLPIEVSNEDSELGKHGQAEMEENNGLEVESKSECTNDLVPSEVLNETESKQPNEAAKHSNIVKTEEHVEVGDEKDLASEGEAEYREGKEITNHASEPAESQVTVSFEGKVNPEDTAGAKEEPIEANEEANDQLPLMTTKIEEGKEIQEREVEGGDDEKMQEQEAGFEIARDDEVHVKQDGETLPTSPTCSLVSVDETGTEFKSNKKLEEENMKLKKMMEKLLEAGKEQLEVISNLSGRVKDLEKQLATPRKKKTRTRSIKRSNVPCIKERVVGVAA